ncbi:MAG: DUF2142 domain-containing protein [Haliea sp.]|nr:DUF2142 domain-containing protein [Haliea sp.]
MHREYTVGTTDPGIYLAAGKLTYLQFNSAKKYSINKAVEVNRYTWRDGEMRDTRSVSVNAPTFYAIPALGVVLGQYLDKSIVQTLTLSRLINGFFAFVVSCIALLALRRGFGVMFVLLLMPMTVAQMASSSQDATCFAIAALCVALLSRLNTELPRRNRRLCLLWSTLLMITGHRRQNPLRCPLAVLPVFCLLFQRPTCHCCRMLLGICRDLDRHHFVGALVALYVSVPFGLEGANWGEQARFVLQSPLEWLGILAESWRQRWDLYLISFIGLVGHLDTKFPNVYLSLAGLTLGLAFFMSYWPERRTFFRSMREQALVPGLIVLATIAGIFLVLYISWSPLKNPIIEGPQGRYFIPPALFLALGAAQTALIGKSQLAYRCLMLAFAAGTLILTPYVIMERYYW